LPLYFPHIRQPAWSSETGHPTLNSNGMLQGL